MFTLKDFELRFGESGQEAPFDGQNKIGIPDDLLGRTFSRGLLRIHNNKSAEKWTRILSLYQDKVGPDCFPFCFDWQGRQFVQDSNGRVSAIDPAVFDRYDCCDGVREFFQVTLRDRDGDVLDDGDFDEFLELTNIEAIGFDQCAGFSIPLIVGGEDSNSNREITDMEVYWELNYQLAR